MAITANYSSLFPRVKKDALKKTAIASFMQTSKTVKASKTSSKSSIGKDLVSLSPTNEMRNVISQFKQSESASLNLSVKVSTEHTLDTKEGQEEALNGMDDMLRMITKDEDEYNSVKSQISSIMRQQGGLSFSYKSKSGKVVNISYGGQKSSDSSKVPSNVEESQTEQKASVYEIMLSMRKVSTTVNEDGTSDMSISEQFFSAIAGYFSKKEVQAEEVASNDYSAAYNQSKSSSATIEVTNVSSNSDPLVLDLDGSGIQLTDTNDGAYFDITADGKKDKVAWVKGNTAFLVYDKNGNGVIDDGSEFFGDQNGAKDGFLELSKYDDNKDGIINNQDRIYNALKLYKDIDGNKQISSNELFTLENMGIKQLNLNCIPTNSKVNGNSVILNGSYERNDGTTGLLADVLLNYK